jgi:hypothetical protein
MKAAISKTKIKTIIYRLKIKIEYNITKKIKRKMNKAEKNEEKSPAR